LDVKRAKLLKAVERFPLPAKSVRLGTLKGEVTVPEGEWWQPMSDEEAEQFPISTSDPQWISFRLGDFTSM